MIGHRLPREWYLFRVYTGKAVGDLNDAIQQGRAERMCMAR